MDPLPVCPGALSEKNMLLFKQKESVDDADVRAREFETAKGYEHHPDGQASQVPDNFLQGNRSDN